MLSRREQLVMHQYFYVAAIFLAIFPTTFLSIFSGSNVSTWWPWWLPHGEPHLGSRRLTQPKQPLINSLAPAGRPRCHFKSAIFNLVLLIGIFTSSKDKALRWMPRDLTDGKSTLVQVMAWCRQATSHHLSQCWSSSTSPYGVTRPQWVNTLRQKQNGWHFPEDIFKCIFLNENGCILMKISMKFVPQGPINNIPALVQIMVWRRSGEEPSEPMMA